MQNKSKFYVTTKCPPTEPYHIWKARRKLQQKALKQYLKKGTMRHLSSILHNEGTLLDPKIGSKTVNPAYVNPNRVDGKRINTKEKKASE